MTLPKPMNFRKSSKRHLTPHPSFTEIQVANFFQARQLKVPCHHHHWLKIITSRFLVQIRRKKETLVLTCAVCVFMHVFTKFQFSACNAERILLRTNLCQKLSKRKNWRNCLFLALRTHRASCSSQQAAISSHNLNTLHIFLTPHVLLQKMCTSISHVYSSTNKYEKNIGIPVWQYTWQTLYMFIQSLLSHQWIKGIANKPTNSWYVNIWFLSLDFVQQLS